MDNFSLKRLINILLVLVFVVASPASAEMPAKHEVLDAMLRVEDYWIREHPDPGLNGWDRATHFMGTMALYSIYQDEKYYDYALNWAAYNDFEVAAVIDPTKPDRRADSHCAGQIYLELNDYDPSAEKIASIKASIEEMVSSPETYYWWWIDALFMSMPAFAKLALADAENADDYLAKMWELFSFTKDQAGGKYWNDIGFGLYSDNGCENECDKAYYNIGDYLWWEHYLFDPPVEDESGQNTCYWSRGNGWVLAALARTLRLLSPDNEHYDVYLGIFKDMASSLIARQREDGFWNADLDDMSDSGAKETSGTALFTYAIAWGINQNDIENPYGHEYLDRDTYAPYVEAAWNAMVNQAVHSDPDGKLGYVQGVGKQPVPAEFITYESTADFGVGAFLLAGSEVFKLASCGTEPDPEARIVLQAEEATINNGQIDWNHPGYTGSGYVNYYNEIGSSVTFTVNVGEGGRRSLLIRFANGSTADRYMDINVNGEDVEYDNVAFNPTATTGTAEKRWSSWGYQQVLIDLVTGDNTIELIADQADGGPNLDKIEIGRVIGADDVAWYPGTDFSQVHSLYGGNTGNVAMEFDVTPMESNIDGVIGYADSATDITAWNSMAVLVRMFTNGKFEARNGNSYAADADLDYIPGKKYHVGIYADTLAGTYDVWVTPEYEEEIKIAEDFAFRSDAPSPDNIGNVCLVGSTSEAFKLENHTIYGLETWYSATDFSEVHPLGRAQGKIEAAFLVQPDGEIRQRDGVDLAAFDVDFAGRAGGIVQYGDIV